MVISVKSYTDYTACCDSGLPLDSSWHTLMKLQTNSVEVTEEKYKHEMEDLKCYFKFFNFSFISINVTATVNKYTADILEQEPIIKKQKKRGYINTHKTFIFF